MVKVRVSGCTRGGACKQRGNALKKSGIAKMKKGYKVAGRSPKRMSVSGHDSNDSVLVAGYLAEFSYDPGRKDAVLKKYEKLLHY